MAPERTEVSRLLLAWREGDETALARLIPLVYEELHVLARRHLRDERPDHTLQTTALIHEAYLRLCGADVAWEGRVHFLAVAAQTMRRILVDHARGRARAKRGGGDAPITLDDALVASPDRPDALLALDEALQRLSTLDDETAAALDISAATVDRELRMAKAWLYRELQPEAGAGDV